MGASSRVTAPGPADRAGRKGHDARWLVAWVGKTDLDAAQAGYADGAGPLAMALQAASPAYQRVVLLSNYPAAQTRGFRTALARHTGYPAASVKLQAQVLASPIDYAAIYRASCAALQALELPADEVELTFHLSPGTPAMAAIWIILAKTRFPARLIQASRQHGVEEVDFFFDLAADFLPEFLRRSDARTQRLLAQDRPASPHFSKIVHRCPAMAEAVDSAHRFALHEVPVLLLGETGTGKELFAEAIAAASRRAGRPFVAVNCGTFTPELANAELFGHKRGAFTGATADRRGYLAEADGGTLFLDEVGDLPHDAQVRLLRALQTGEILPVGAARPQRVDVRVVAATHRDLLADVAQGRFREDLFHRLAVGIVHLPPLRQRGPDLELLIEHFLARINDDGRHTPEWQPKQLAPAALQRLAAHPWPGNIRELYNTLVRCCVWSTTPVVEAADVERSLLRSPQRSPQSGPAAAGPLGLPDPLPQPFDLRAHLDAVAAHCIGQALAHTGGHRGRAAQRLGFANHQTLGNWIKRLGLPDGLA